jgi:hypothetical protein
MQVIREYTVPQNGKLTIDVPPAFNGQRVEVLVLTEQPAAKPAKKMGKRGPAQQTTGLETLVGKYKHYTPEQNEKIDRELSAMRDEWERPIF